jgi:hypothetical protein
MSSTKVIKLSMHDFHSKLKDRYGSDLQFEWQNGWESQNYDSEGLVDRQCHFANCVLYKISLPAKEKINSIGIKLKEENILVTFDWCWNDKTDIRVQSEITNILESTLQINFLIDHPEKWSLRDIVCNLHQLEEYNQNPVKESKSEIFVIYYYQE